MKDGGTGQRATNENVNILLSSKEEVRCLENHHCSHLLYGQFEVKNDKKFFLDEKKFSCLPEDRFRACHGGSLHRIDRANSPTGAECWGTRAHPMHGFLAMDGAWVAGGEDMGRGNRDSF